MVLEGGVFFNDVKAPRNGKKLSPAEIKRVKGLGCLQDKRYDDVFNVRVITRNGKLTSEEQRKVAEAAEKFGSGEVTMTTRLTLEIQGVPYDNLDAVFAFLEEAGLETGGTGSKVRPVVSCKVLPASTGLSIPSIFPRNSTSYITLAITAWICRTIQDRCGRLSQ